MNKLEKQKRKEDRGFIIDTLMSILELIILPFRLLFRGISSIFKY